MLLPLAISLAQPLETCEEAAERTALLQGSEEQMELIQSLTGVTIEPAAPEIAENAAKFAHFERSPEMTLEAAAAQDVLTAPGPAPLELFEALGVAGAWAETDAEAMRRERRSEPVAIMLNI